MEATSKGTSCPGTCMCGSDYLEINFWKALTRIKQKVRVHFKRTPQTIRQWLEQAETDIEAAKKEGLYD